MDRVGQACQALHFQRSLGHEGLAGALASYTLARSTPDDRASNFIGRVRARSRAEIAAVFAEADRALPHCAHRLFYCDPMTPPEFMAELVARGFRPHRTLVMARSCNLQGRLEDADCETVHDARQWLRLSTLLSEAALERSSENFLSTIERGTEQRLAGFRRRAPSNEVFLLNKARRDLGFVAGTASPIGVGVVGDLFVLTTERRKGWGRKLIADVCHELRDSGAHTVVMEVPPASPGFQLARALGFEPLCVTEAYEGSRS